MKKDSSSTTRSVERTLSILECFISQERELSLSEIADKIDLPLSTVHRLVNTLADNKFLSRSEDDKKYYLGPKILQLGSSALSFIKKDLRNIARPYLIKLNQKFNESVALYIIDGFDRLCIDRIESTHLLRNVVPIGQTVPLSLGAIGNAMLSYMPIDTVKSIIPNISEEHKLKFEEIRKNKYYISRGERVPGIIAIVVPILDSLGNLVCTINISGPEIRFDEDSTKEMLAYILEVGREFSNDLGYKGEY